MNLQNQPSDKLPIANPGRVYKNNGNHPLIDLLDNSATRILDVGCGAGDNAALVKSRRPYCEVFGITWSDTEADIAKEHLTSCWVFDVEGPLPEELKKKTFGTIIFSHILEHLHDPAAVLNKFTGLLASGGSVLIAVPNVLSWAMRWQFLRGNFEYDSTGVLDDTHLRFFTYFTADKYLLSMSPDLEVATKAATGSVPLWWLRRHIFPRAWSERIDQWGCQHWPNLFGAQVLIKAIKR